MAKTFIVSIWFFLVNILITCRMLFFMEIRIKLA